ncbi:carbohydrate ABC transporter permease [Ruania zhangjianzhongii]|uniref:carbohydrate ABC transporter permease n=1 Tax=Ruania zhangjianzhongii TaxID=2603206 RepID=UPI001AEFA0CD|nr:sugar ABC transporter permease [Ruania zhangjianzhongii]
MTVRQVGEPDAAKAATDAGPSAASQPIDLRERNAGKRRARRREYWLFAAFAVPNVLVIAVFGIWPLLVNAVLSFTRWDFISPWPIFVGLENYRWILTSPAFLSVIKTTIIFTGAVVAASVTIGLAVALLLNQRLVGRNIVRTVTFAPHVLSGAAVAMIWLFIFDPNFGLARILFDLLGMTSPNWVAQSSTALIAITIVHIWKGIGFNAIVYLSALQGLPTELYEAAEIDGAGAWRRHRALTIPLLSPTTFFLVTVETIGATKAFDIIAVMTGGGPGDATTVLSWFIYEAAFESFQVGRAAAGAMVLFITLLGIFAIQRRFVERKVHYQ